MNKYKIFCRQPGDIGWQESGWVDEPITVCPNNAKHVVNKNSVRKSAIRRLWDSHAVPSFQTTVTEYMRVISFEYPGTDTVDPICTITINSYMEISAESYNIRIFDITNGNIIAEATFNNTAPATCDMGIISNIPVFSSDLALQAKVNGGDGTDPEIYVRGINVYTIKQFK